MKLFSTDDLNDSDYSLTFNDISLVPGQISTLNHRSEADTSTEFLGLKLKLPVISSPMESVTGIEMCTELGRVGGLGILNRFDNSFQRIVDSPYLTEYIKAISIGTDLVNIDKLGYILDLFKTRPLICLDTANAANRLVLDTALIIKNNFPDIKIIVGNIAFNNYFDISNEFDLLTELNRCCDAIRVGIGNGSVCSTSVRTGVGVGQVSSLVNIISLKKYLELPIKIIADGGLTTPGDICKALALGADAVMLGRMLSGTKEAPGEVIKFNGALYKKYRGSASYGVKGTNKYVEGEETLVEYKGSVEDVINSIKDGLQSSMAYMNAHNLKEFTEKAYFTLLSHSSYMERLAKV